MRGIRHAPSTDDALLDKLVGDWNGERKFGSGRHSEKPRPRGVGAAAPVCGTAYADAAAPPKYEAIVLIATMASENVHLPLGRQFWGDYSPMGSRRADRSFRTQWSS